LTNNKISNLIRLFLNLILTFNPGLAPEGGKMLFKNYMQAFKSLGAHLLLCAFVIAMALLIGLVPGNWPYVIGPAVVICLGILSMWYKMNFETSFSIIIIYMIAMAIALISFILATLDWALGWNMIPTPWVYVMSTEGLPIAFILLFFMCLNLED